MWRSHHSLACQSLQRSTRFGFPSGATQASFIHSERGSSSHIFGRKDRARFERTNNASRSPPKFSKPHSSSTRSSPPRYQDRKIARRQTEQISSGYGVGRSAYPHSPVDEQEPDQFIPDNTKFSNNERVTQMEYPDSDVFDDYPQETETPRSSPRSTGNRPRRDAPSQARDSDFTFVRDDEFDRKPAPRKQLNREKSERNFSKPSNKYDSNRRGRDNRSIERFQEPFRRERDNRPNEKFQESSFRRGRDNRATEQFQEPLRNRVKQSESKSSRPVESRNQNKISADQIVRSLHWFGSYHSEANELPHGYHLEEIYDDYSRTRDIDRSHSQGEFLYGLHCVHSALARDRRTIYGLLTDKSPSELEALSPLHATLVERCKERRIPIVVTKTGRLEQLSGGFGNRHSSAILVCSPFQPLEHNLMRSYQSDTVVDLSSPSHETLLPPHRFTGEIQTQAPLWLALDRIQDPHNVGAILRSAWFYGIHGVVLPLRDSCPVNPTCANISTGATEVLPLYTCSNLSTLVQTCTENGWKTVGTHSNTEQLQSTSIDLPDLVVDSPTLIVMGNEGEGVASRILKHCSHILQIPTRSAPDSAQYGSHLTGIPQHEIDLSLNVSVAAGVILNHCTTKPSRKE